MERAILAGRVRPDSAGDTDATGLGTANVA
jgi:hypothetical protein